MILGIDQGTSSSRALLFDRQMNVIGSAQRELPRITLKPGWVEQDPELLWQSVAEVAREVLSHHDIRSVAAIGLTNQRETTILWDRATGQPIYNAIVWSDSRTAQHCAELGADGSSQWVAERTGLKLDPYFSATKIGWILDQVTGARRRADRGELAFGTVDSFLIWRLTGGRHLTDVTNASRTSLLNLNTLDWDDELLDYFDIPASLLPTVMPCHGDFGHTTKALFDREIPISGVAGDQQAAAIGQGCFSAASAKATFGTGAFVLSNDGDTPVVQTGGLISTVAYQIAGHTSYATEGSIFCAGAAVQWLRDQLGLIDKADDTESIARQMADNGGVYLVPALAGLGAPYWQPDARGIICGLSFSSDRNAIVRATLESVAYQMSDLLAATLSGSSERPLRVDGAMANNDWLMQFLADILDRVVERPVNTETTVAGAAWLAGFHTEFFGDQDWLSRHWRCDRRFEPDMTNGERARLLEAWADAVSRTVR